MRNLAKKLCSEELYTEAATVLRAGEGQLWLRAGDRELAADRAVSCLVEPEPGDRVLVATGETDCVVLAVLSRPGDGAPCISAPGNLAIRLGRGRLSLAARDGVEVTTPRELAVSAASVALRALEGSVVVETLRLLGSRLHAEISKVRLVAAEVDSLAERVRARVKRSYRFIEEFDQVRAEHLDYRARGVARVHGENTVITAAEIAKLDGEQILVG
jgi:hypothetical protein